MCISTRHFDLSNAACSTKSIVKNYFSLLFEKSPQAYIIVRSSCNIHYMQVWSVHWENETEKLVFSISIGCLPTQCHSIWHMKQDHINHIQYLLHDFYAATVNYISLGDSDKRHNHIEDLFPTQRPATRSFDVFIDLRLNTRLSKQSWDWWFGTPLCSLWRHCNELYELRCVCFWKELSKWYSRKRLTLRLSILLTCMS